MAEDLNDDDGWDAGFESGRRLVLGRLGPVQWVFQRPERFVRRFFHRVYPLSIEDWTLPLPPLHLGSLCNIAASLRIRFQPTIRFAREHLDHLDDLAGHIRTSHAGLLQDLTEQELHRLEWDTSWLEQGCAAVERTIERNVSEHLAIRDIQCRVRCSVQPSFGDLSQISADSVAPWSRHRALYLTLMQRHKHAEEEHHRSVTEYSRLSRERELEREHQTLDLERQREVVAKAKLEADIERLKTDLAAEERRQAERRETELRLRKEQIAQTAALRNLELEADLEEKNRRAQTMDEMENHLKREIELLAMERQRLLLEEEIREVKVAKAKGWVINAKRRFPLGNQQEPPPEEAAEVVKPSEGAD
jgi:hypothetical protein